MNKEEIFNVIKKVVGWGLGAIVTLAGVGIMIFHSKLDIDFPEYLYIGFGLVVLGLAVYILMVVLDYKERMFDKQTKLKLVETPKEQFDEKVERYNKVFSHKKKK